MEAEGTISLTMIAVRAGLFAALGLPFGLALFTLALRPDERRDAHGLRHRALIAGMLAAALLLSVLWLAITAAEMGDTPLLGTTSDTLDAILYGTSIGTSWQIRMAALALALLCLGGAQRGLRFALPGLVAASGVALGSLAWTGHGAMDEGTAGWIHLVADITHLLAAGAWIGALAAFLSLVWRRPHDAELSFRMLHGFASAGTVLVLVLLVTGAINSWMLVQPNALAQLPTDPWGRLLLAKMGLFVLMLGLAAANRFRLTPALGNTLDAPTPALSALRRSLMIEIVAGVLILLLVAALGTLSPPVSTS